MGDRSATSIISVIGAASTDRSRSRPANATWLEDIFVIPDVDRNQAKVRITLGTREQIPPARMTLKVRVSLLVGKEAFIKTKDIEVKRPFHEMETEVVVAMSDVKLWFPETPHLYAAEVTLADEHGVCDSRQVRFGMRKIDWSGGLKLNGRPHLLRACGDNVADVLTGLPSASKDFFAKRLMPIKAFGFNTIRFHSHVPPEECFQAADEAGVFIQGELPVVYFNRFLPNKELLRKELVRILKCYRNHPSFFSLAMGNEFSINVVHFTDREKQEFQDAIREFYDLAKRLDPTRPILSNEGEPRLLPTDIHTLYSDVFYGEPIGGRPFVLHEYGSYRGSLPDIASRNEFTGVCAPYKGVIEQAKWVEDHSLQGIYPTILKNSQLLLEIGRKDLLEAVRRNPQHPWVQLLVPDRFSGRCRRRRVALWHSRSVPATQASHTGEHAADQFTDRSVARRRDGGPLHLGPMKARPFRFWFRTTGRAPFETAYCLGGSCWTARR